MIRYDEFRETKGSRVRHTAYLCLVAINALWERLPERVGQKPRIQKLDSGQEIIVAERTLAHRAYFALIMPALRWAAPHLFETSRGAA